MPASLLHGRTTGHMAPENEGRLGYVVAPQAATQSPASVQHNPVMQPPEISPPGSPYTSPNQSRRFRWPQGDDTNDKLIYRDRHPLMDTGHEFAGRISSMPDPPMDGPVRPSMRLVNRTYNWTAGLGAAYADDLSRNYNKSADGTLYIGQQDGTWSTIYGGTPGFYREGPGGVPVGNPNTGPGMVYGGPPHGYHTMQPPAGQQAQARYRARPQMQAARVDRLSNSRIAGQNYSQRTKHQGT